MTATALRPKPPERILTERCIVRRWTVDDAPALHEAIVASTEHLRPWMPWIAFEPQTVQQRRDLIAGWSRDWDDSAEFVYGILDLDDATVVGGTGLHRRGGPNELEIGYWIHVDRAGRGLATEASRALTDAALAIADIGCVVLRHDKANVRSGAIPRKLGYRYEGDQPSPIEAPAETGVQSWWRYPAMLPSAGTMP